MAKVPEIEGYSDFVHVAKGGFGTVYRAHQDRFGREVALKVLNVDLDDRGRQRFELECITMGRLSWHPNVVVIHDSGTTEDGRPYLVMEYLDGGSLSDRLLDSALAWPDAVAVGVQASGALGAAHAAGVLHRDLKPENLLVGPFGEAKLGDFGIAAVVGASQTTAGHTSFTVAHVAPEVIRGQRPDERSDLYGLASTLHALISGTPPLAAEAEAPMSAQMMRVLETPPPRLSGVPDELADLLTLTLGKDPSGRPQSASEFGQVLQRIQADNGQPVTELRLARKTRGGGVDVGTDPSTDHAQSSQAILQGDPLPTLRSQATEPVGESSLPTVDLRAPDGPPPSLPPPPAGPQDGGLGATGGSPARRSRRSIAVALVALAALVVGAGYMMAAGRAPGTTTAHGSAAQASGATSTTQQVPASDGTTRSGTPSEVALGLEPDGLGVVGFGVDSDQAVADLTAELGTPDSDDLSTCVGGVYRFIMWENLLVVAEAGPEGTFLSYDLLSSADGTGDVRPSLTTPEGMTIGSTVAQLEDAYPGEVLVGVFGADGSAGFSVASGYRGFVQSDLGIEQVARIGAGEQPSCAGS